MHIILCMHLQCAGTYTRARTRIPQPTSYPSYPTLRINTAASSASTLPTTCLLDFLPVKHIPYCEYGSIPTFESLCKTCTEVHDLYPTWSYQLDRGAQLVVQEVITSLLSCAWDWAWPDSGCLVFICCETGTSAVTVFTFVRCCALRGVLCCNCVLSALEPWRCQFLGTRGTVPAAVTNDCLPWMQDGRWCTSSGDCMGIRPGASVGAVESINVCGISVTLRWQIMHLCGAHVLHGMELHGMEPHD